MFGLGFVCGYLVVELLFGVGSVGVFCGVVLSLGVAS